MAANHTALRVERQGLFEDQLRAGNTRSVRRASGLVLVGNPYLTGLWKGCPSSTRNWPAKTSSIGERVGQEQPVEFRQASSRHREAARKIPAYKHDVTI